MKILVNWQEQNLNLRFPTGLVLNRVTAGIVARALGKKGLPLSRKQMVCCIRALNRYRKTHPDWVLVEVNSADGDRVEMKL